MLFEIVYIGSTKASLVKNQTYNSGNVDFELQIKDNSIVEVCGVYEVKDVTEAEEL